VGGARAELRKDDLMLVHAYEVPLSSRGRPAAIARGRQQQEALLDKVAATLTVPPTMHLDRLVEVDSPGFLLPRLAEQAELTVLGQDHPALSGHMPLGHTANTVATMSRRPIVAVPRGWSPVSDDRRPIAVAIDGLHSSSSTLGFAFAEGSLRQVAILVVHSAPLSEMESGEQDTRLNLADFGWLEGRQSRRRRADLAADRSTAGCRSFGSGRGPATCRRHSVPRTRVGALDPLGRPRRTRASQLPGRDHPAAVPSLGHCRLTIPLGQVLSLSEYEDAFRDVRA
jgi:hypothetical protein